MIRPAPIATVIAVVALVCSLPALARECVTKHAVATSSSEKDAKWYALETTVQALSWSLWPGFVATNKVEGYSIADSYRCSMAGSEVTCHVTTAFCRK